MPRRRNSQTGVVVNVDDSTASRLGSQWVDADEPAGSAGDAPKGNASREEWAAYANSLGVQYEQDAKRDDIRAAIAAAESDPDGGDDSGDSDPDDE